MTNERLREALNAAGMTSVDLASLLEVDPRTVERWITLGRTPYARHRSKVAAIVDEREAYLWPDALTADQRERASASEVVHTYPRRSSVPAVLWAQLFERASASIDVLIYAGLFLPEQHPELVGAMCDKAASGVRLRLLLGDPDSEPVRLRGLEEGIGDAVPAKIRNAMSFYRPHAAHGCLDVRLHSTTLYTSIYRFDDEMFANSHLYGRPAAQAPVMHLRRLGAGDLFDTYVDMFERIWAGARQWTVASTVGVG